MLGDHAGGRHECRHRHRRVESHEARPHHRPRRCAHVVDTRRIDVADPIAVNVHTDLNHSNELHQVDHHLPVGVAQRDRPRARRGRFRAFQRRVDAIPVLVDAPAGVGEVQRRPVGPGDHEPAHGTEALSDLADADRGDAMTGHLRREVGRRDVLVRAGASPGENDRPAGGRLGPGRQVQGEVDGGVSLDGRSGGQRSDSRNYSPGCTR